MVGAVVYRDHCDGIQRLEEFALSKDIDAFERFLGSVQCKGGGDGPEDVHGGLNLACRCVRAHTLHSPAGTAW
jgi:hypothetical protein